MKNQEKHDYLIALIKELEKAGNETNLNNFIIVLEDTLKVKYRLRNYFDYPISAADYDELITYAENLLGVNRFGSKDDPHYEHLLGRTTPTSGGPSASNDVDSFNTMSDIEVEALVDYALIDMELVEHILKNYTPDQLTIDVVKQAAALNSIIDGMKVNKQTADYIEMKIKQIQNEKLNNMMAYDDRITDDIKDLAMEDDWVPNAETIAAIEEAAKADPKDLHSWEDVKKEFYGDETDPNYIKYWTKGRDAHFFYASDFIDAWKCADIWHKEIYYWPYN